MSSSPLPSLSTRPTPSPSSASPQPHRNPVSLRLYKVLGANFDDDATKEALNTLSELYPTTGTIKQIKQDGDLSSDSDSDSDWDGQDGQLKLPQLPPNSIISSERRVTTGTAALARKNLRRDIETKLAETSRMFVKAFGEVDQKLDSLQEHITAMRVQCDDAQAQLSSTNEACKSLLERAGNLREQRQAISTQQQILSLFLHRFTLTPSDISALTSRDVPLGKSFFEAMDKAVKIREDCRVLMGVGGEEGPSQVGLDILTTTSSHLEQAYEKIFRYLTTEFQNLMGRGGDRVDPDYAGSLEVTPIMREAVRRLRDRPELLAETLNTLSQSLSPTLLSSFLTALTRGGPGGVPRPIELHAHDPLRYVGDMMAWVHQAIAAEREFLESLFGLHEIKGAGGSSRGIDMVEEGEDERRMIGSVRKRQGIEEEWIGEVMDRCVGKLCGPLKVRVQQTVRSQESPIISYKIANLLQFYLVTMKRTIGEEAVLSKTLKEMTDISFKVFFDGIEAQGRALLRVTLDLDDPALTPPATVTEHIQTLREILSVYESSHLDDEHAVPVSSSNSSEPHVKDEQLLFGGVDRILDVMIDPAIEMCVAASEAKSRFRRGWDGKVFALNCLTYLQNVLESYPFAGNKRKMLDDVIEERVNDLIEEHYNNILADANLNNAAVACVTMAPGEKLSNIWATTPPILSGALSKFSEWLSGLEVVHSPRLAQLTAQRLHTRIHQAALERLANTYKLLCELVRKPENGYEAASTLLGSQRPFGQIHLLRQIFGLPDDDER
ncbi:hypothetical protein JAAARDRAFT_70472 [Jaapia argillacea MUCL 33604]|uniref:Conserved oligomeric Golgi complex subunit 6 n=1 Tax=Jaapia argillacea MUCL 33604 TaxID=933084 RepID=A0A067PZU3_9AGAM|nr:hypothetical protein JAAARDRAFT_70472 [Jaapia argillacea MUCL 33604]